MNLRTIEKDISMHYLRLDFRRNSLDLIIEGLTNSIKVLETQMRSVDWYDLDFYLTESEPLYGLAFISFQNYINSNIKDLTGNIDPITKMKFYSMDKNLNWNGKTKIELINGLANYAKHKYEGIPHKNTKLILDSFNLNYLNELEPNNSAIFQGLAILDEKWDLNNIKDHVIDWRELIWSTNEINK